MAAAEAENSAVVSTALNTVINTTQRGSNMGKHTNMDGPQASGDGQVVASGAEAEDGEDKPGPSDINLTQLLEKYGKLQNNPLLLLEDKKKNYQREGFRVRFRLSRAFRGLEKQEIIASRPDVSNLNGKKRKKELQKLMEELEGGLMLFDPDKESKIKAKEREEERQRLLRECRANAEKWKTKSEEHQQTSVSYSNGDLQSRGPSRTSQYMTEYWGAPAKLKKGKPAKGDWRLKNKVSGKPWWHNFTKKKKPKITWGANINVTDGTTTPLEVMKTNDEKGNPVVNGADTENKTDSQKFFITNPGSDSDAYSAVNEWQRRNAERKMGKSDRSCKLKMAAQDNKTNNGNTNTRKASASNGNNSNTDKSKNSDFEVSGVDIINTNDQGQVANAELSGSRTSLATNKDDKNLDNSDEMDKLDEEDLSEKAKYSFMAMGGFSSGFKSCASSVTSASTNGSGANSDMLDQAKIEMLLRVKDRISGGSHGGSWAGSRAGSHAGSRAGSHVGSHAGSKPGSTIPKAVNNTSHSIGKKTRGVAGGGNHNTKQTIKKPATVQKAIRKSVSFRTVDEDNSSQDTNENRRVKVPSGAPRIDITNPDLPGQVSASKSVDPIESRKTAVTAGILKDSTSPPKIRRAQSASAAHAPRHRPSSGRAKDDSAVPELQESEKPLKTCRYMYTMCKCQRVGTPATLYKLQQKRRKTVGVITVFGCKGEEVERETKSSSNMVCPFCAVFPQRRIKAWLQDVPIVVVN